MWLMVSQACAAGEGERETRPRRRSGRGFKGYSLSCKETGPDRQRKSWSELRQASWKLPKDGPNDPGRKQDTAARPWSCGIWSGIAGN